MKNLFLMTSFLAAQLVWAHTPSEGESEPHPQRLAQVARLDRLYHERDAVISDLGLFEMEFEALDARLDQALGTERGWCSHSYSENCSQAQRLRIVAESFWSKKRQELKDVRDRLSKLDAEIEGAEALVSEPARVAPGLELAGRSAAPARSACETALLGIQEGRMTDEILAAVDARELARQAADRIAGNLARGLDREGLPLSASAEVRAAEIQWMQARVQSLYFGKHPKSVESLNAQVGQLLAERRAKIHSCVTK